MLTKPVYLEIDKPNYVPIYTVQYDYNSRFYEITILNNSQPLDLTGIRVIVAGKKPDGKEVFNSCKVLDAKKGLIQLELTEQMNAVNGASEYALELFSADGMLSSQPFKLIVTRSTISKSVESSKELGALKDALNDVQDIDNRFAQTNAQLSQKMDKNAILSMSNLGQDVKESMTGGSVAVVGKNSVSDINLIYNSISPEKMMFINEGRNKLDMSRSTLNTLMYKNGNCTTNNEYFVSHFIKVTEGQIVKVATQRYDTGTPNRQFRNVIAYNDALEIVPELGEESYFTLKSYVVPAGVSYVRICSTYRDADGDFYKKIMIETLDEDVENPIGDYKVELKDYVKLPQSSIDLEMLNFNVMTNHRDILFDKGKKYIGTYGLLRGYAPYNTIEAIKMSKYANAWGVEIDLRMTKDYEIVLFHDDDISINTTGVGTISDYTLEQLKELNITQFQNLYDYPVKIPTLADALDLCDKFDLIPFLDIKGYSGSYEYENAELYINKIYDLLNERNMVKKCVIVVQEMTKLFKLVVDKTDWIISVKVPPSVDRDFLIGGYYLEKCNYAGYDRCLFQPECQTSLSEASIKEIHKLGIPIYLHDFFFESSDIFNSYNLPLDSSNITHTYKIVIVNGECSCENATIELKNGSLFIKPKDIEMNIIKQLDPLITVTSNFTDSAINAAYSYDENKIWVGLNVNEYTNIHFRVKVRF